MSTIVGLGVATGLAIAGAAYYFVARVRARRGRAPRSAARARCTSAPARSERWLWGRAQKEDQAEAQRRAEKKAKKKSTKQAKTAAPPAAATAAAPQQKASQPAVALAAAPAASAAPAQSSGIPPLPAAPAWDKARESRNAQAAASEAAFLEKLRQEVRGTSAPAAAASAPAPAPAAASPAAAPVAEPTTPGASV
jgi:hypothetical protein